MRNIEPWFAVNLSLVLPGLGQLFTKRYRWAIFFFVLYGAGGGIFLALAVAPWGNTVMALVALAAWFLAHLANLVNAHRMAQQLARRTNSSDFEASRRLGKDPWIAVFLSQIVPGLGHVYAGRWILGPTLLTLLVGTLWYVKRFPLGAAALAMVAPLLICWHAHGITPSRRSSSGGLLVAFLLLFLVQSLAHHLAPEFVKDRYLQAFVLPGNSMAPALLPGDYVLVRRCERYAPTRGDVIAYPNPMPAPTTPVAGRPVVQSFCHRVVGLPGDTLRMADKGLFLNGKAHKGGPSVNRHHMVYRKGRSARRDNWGPLTIPAGHVFVMGDNRDNARDSRFHGPVPLHSVIGRAYRIYWPAGRSGPLY